MIRKRVGSLAFCTFSWSLPSFVVPLHEPLIRAVFCPDVSTDPQASGNGLPLVDPVRLVTSTSSTHSTPPKPSLLAAGPVYGANLAPLPEPLLDIPGARSNCPAGLGGMCPACAIEDEPADKVLRTWLLSPLLAAETEAWLPCTIFCSRSCAYCRVVFLLLPDNCSCDRHMAQVQDGVAQQLTDKSPHPAAGLGRVAATASWATAWFH